MCLQTDFKTIYRIENVKVMVIPTKSRDNNAPTSKIPETMPKFHVAPTSKSITKTCFFFSLTQKLVQLLRKSRMVEFEVQNTSKGFGCSSVRELFSPFYQTRSGERTPQD